MRIHKLLLFHKLLPCSLTLLLGACQAQSAPLTLPDELADLTAQPMTKKLIEYGWDMPTPQTLQANPDRLAAAPFDGLTIRLAGGQLIFRQQAMDAAQVARDVAALRSINSGKLKNSYLSVMSGAAPGWSWLSDSDWAQTERSARLIAGAAKAAGLRGVMFDMEPYELNPWQYAAQPGADKLDFAQFQVRVRARGAAFMRAMQSEYPGIQMYSLYLLSATDDVQGATPAETQNNLAGSGYGLWPAFVDGLLGAAGPDVSIVEGNEHAYDYLHAEEFEQSRSDVRRVALPLLSAENRAKYAAQVKMGQAVFADGVLNAWKSPRFTGYYFPSDAAREQMLGHNIVQALRNADEVAWFYNENFDWWSEPKPGQERLRAVVQSARQVARAGKSIPPIAGLGDVEAAYNAKVSVGGDLLGTNNGPVSFEINGVNYPAGEVSPNCGTWNAGQRYSCTFPGGWSGTIRPNIAGKPAFDPPTRSYQNLKKDDWQANFTLKP